MPLKSKKQRAYLWAHKPSLAQEFETMTPKTADLPVRAPKKPRGGIKR